MIILNNIDASTDLHLYTWWILLLCENELFISTLYFLPFSQLFIHKKTSPITVINPTGWGSAYAHEHSLKNQSVKYNICLQKAGMMEQEKVREKFHSVYYL